MDDDDDDDNNDDDVDDDNDDDGDDTNETKRRRDNIRTNNLRQTTDCTTGYTKSRTQHSNIMHFRH